MTDPETLRKILYKGKKARQLVLDYAFGISIMGLIPIGGILTLKGLIAIALIVKMTWDLGKIWHFPRGQDGLALVGYGAGWLGGILMAIMAWFTFFAVGLYVPYVQGLAMSASFFTLVWIVGQATNHFYQVGRIETFAKEMQS